MQQVKIFELLERVHAGKVVIPDFQRPFVWKISQVQELLNSVANGFFIGSILMLDDFPNNRFAPRPILGVEEITFDENETIKYILDGQQRVQSLYYAFYEPEELLYDELVRFYYSHKNNEIIAAPDVKILARRLRANEKDIRDYIKYSTGLDVEELPTMGIFKTDADFYGFIDRGSLNETFERQLRSVYEKIQAFTIPVVSLPQTTSDEDIVNIFERINRTGTELSTFDLAVARYYTIGVRLNALVKDVEKESFLKVVKKDSILKVISILKERDPKPKTLLNLAEGDDNKIRRIKFEGDWKRATKFLIEAYQRMESHYGTKRIGRKRPFIPYTSLLIPLATLIHEVREFGETESIWSKIDSWYWYNVFSQRYTSAVDGKSLQDYKSIKQWLRNGVPPQFPTITKQQVKQVMEDSRAVAALSKAFYSRLIMQQVCDLKTGQLITEYTDCNIDHIFPKSRREDGNVNAIFNQTLLTKSTNQAKGAKRPSEFIIDVCLPSHRNEVERFMRTLKSHFINDIAYNALLNDDFEGFIKARAEYFVNYLFEKHFQGIMRE